MINLKNDLDLLNLLFQDWLALKHIFKLKVHLSRIEKRYNPFVTAIRLTLGRYLEYILGIMHNFNLFSCELGYETAGKRYTRK